MKRIYCLIISFILIVSLCTITTNLAKSNTTLAKDTDISSFFAHDNNEATVYFGEVRIDEIADISLQLAKNDSFTPYIQSNLAMFIVIVIIVLAFLLLAITYIVLLFKDKSKKEKLNRSYQAKAKFLKYMSNECTQPIEEVKHMLKIVEKNCSKEDMEYIENAHVSIDFLSEMISHFDGYSKLENDEVTLNLEWISQENFIKNLSAILLPLLNPKKMKLSFVRENCSMEYFEIDTPKLMEILLNILSNAIKYTEPHGEIEVKWRCEYFENDEAMLNFEISDNGIGMSEKFLKSAMLPFEREKTIESVLGSGLGLAITKYLVEIMNGTIRIESRLGIGTTVKIQIPTKATDKYETEK